MKNKGAGFYLTIITVELQNRLFCKLRDQQGCNWLYGSWNSD